MTDATMDMISDFLRGADKIDLSVIDANNSTAKNDAFVFVGTAAFSSTNARGQLRYQYDNTAGFGVVYGSTDADGDAEFAIKVVGVSELAASDFLV